ncbi:ubiquinone biosynthesis hydrox [Dacryopinax primogenitus]|uniref:Ubiquinone biosynthesis monooxygenase COQ6, mitochondrial n=1 Tax=Dacryopinax primogenitus (strain DJM 731) TaxID=1858805 RepID=M5GEZ9_DACPD|nr:ubiquinone biosynthesis hydrox [Dacryopinax primogenitus]EJU03703.1 ubiquinone biosynthesis hydrox [Dacryopinax primogenitus]
MRVSVARVRFHPALARVQHITPRARYATTAPTPAEDYDIVIVGGGPAGLALAGALASSPAVYATSRIALVEAGSLDKVREWTMGEGEFSNRVSSITNVSREFLHGFGAWDYLDQTRTMPVEEIQAWDGLSSARITFNTSDIPSSSPARSPHLRPSQIATMVENLNIQRALLRTLEDKPDVNLLDNVKVLSITRNSADETDDYPHLTLSDGRTLRARLLIGADGPSSPVRAYTQISSYGWAYPTHAVVGTLFHRPHPLGLPNATAFQRFLPTGPIAFLPLSPTAASLVWSTRPELAAAMKQLDSAALARYVNAAFRLPWLSLNYLNTVLLESYASGTPLTASQAEEEISFRQQAHSIDASSALSSLQTTIGVPAEGSDSFPPLIHSLQRGTIASFPLRLTHADSYLGSSSQGRGRTALVGDAAHTCHPLAGQGLNMGLADVCELVRCLDAGAQHGSDLGTQVVLQPYARNRYAANHSMLSVTDKLHKLYALQSWPAVWARSTGLEVVNELLALKGAIMLGGGAAREEPNAGKAAMRFAADAVEVGASTLYGAKALLSGLGSIAGTVVGKAVGSLITNAGKQ